MAKKKKFRMIDAILTVICVVFVAEAAAPAAAIGNSQFSWWIFLIIAFLMPVRPHRVQAGNHVRRRRKAASPTGYAARSATSGAAA